MQDVQLQLPTWKEELKQFTRDSCHAMMQELEGEVSCLTEMVEQCIDCLEVRVRAADLSAVSFTAICSKEEKITGESDNASNAGRDGHGWYVVSTRWCCHTIQLWHSKPPFYTSSVVFLPQASGV